MPNHYQLLGLRENASQEDIKKAYRVVAQQFHPDKHQGAMWAEEALKRINAAYEVLSDPKKRASYDFQLQLEQQQLMKPTAQPAYPTSPNQNAIFLLLLAMLALVSPKTNFK